MHKDAGVVCPGTQRYVDQPNFIPFMVKSDVNMMQARLRPTSGGRRPRLRV